VAVYVSIYLSLGLLALVFPRDRGMLFYPLIAVFLIWFMGFRYETGCDYAGYLQRWIQFELPITLDRFSLGSEAGFDLLLGFVDFLARRRALFGRQCTQGLELRS